MSTTLAPSDQAPLSGLGRKALIVGVVALVVCVVGAFFDPTQFFSAYLAAYVFWIGVGLSSLVILMIYHLTGGAWGFLVRRILEASARTLPFLAILFIPIACGVSYLYVWARPDAAKVFEGLGHKQIYLNVPFFIGRAVLYFVVWTAIAYFLDRWSAAQDRSGDPRYRLWMRQLSGPGLLIYGLTFTFAAVDWIMSLEPAFHSTIFGPLIAADGLVSALAFTLLVLFWLTRRPVADGGQLAPRVASDHGGQLAPRVASDSRSESPTLFLSPDVCRDLGNLLLTFLILWAYLVFFQFVLIWIADLRYEVIYYLPRVRNGWDWVAWALFLFAFVVPFFGLLMREVKANLPVLARVAGLLLFMQLVFAFYLVVPLFHADDILHHWMDFLTPLAVGGLWLFFFLGQLARRPLLPLNDPCRASAVHLREVDAEEAREEQEAIHA